MKLKQRNGVLGLETAKQVMISFLILAVTGVAIILALSSLDDSVGDSIDNEVRTSTMTTTNESSLTSGIDIVYLNETGYTLSGYNTSWSGITISAIWNVSNFTTGATYNTTIGTDNASISSGVVTNTTTTFDGMENVSLSYYFTYTYTEDTGRMDSIVGNVSGGIETFFASTGTIFSILIVIVIILAISIIIWAVGRFGQQVGQEANTL